MLQSQFLALAVFFALTSAVPLNINLGAYSPAFVVGDGEISLGGKETAASIMGALQGAAVSSAGANAAAPAAAAAPGTKAAESTVPATSGTVDQEQAAAIAAIADPVTPLSPGADAAQQPGLATGAGLGNDLEPRIRPRIEEDVDVIEDEQEVAERMVEEQADAAVEKRQERVHARDLAGFDRALNYATTTLTTSPAVQLGTGEAGAGQAGVGILVSAGVNNGGKAPAAAAAAAPAAAPAAAAAAKREVVEEKPEKRARVTTLYVRELPEPESAVQDRDVDKRSMETSISVDVSKARTLAMTFVEEE